jgi:hypothetical protein
MYIYVRRYNILFFNICPCKHTHIEKDQNKKFSELTQRFNAFRRHVAEEQRITLEQRDEAKADVSVRVCM